MWIRTSLGEASIFISRGISPKYLESGGVRVLNQKCIRNHEINYELARRHNIELKQFSENRYIKLGDVLINSTGQGTLGRVAQVRKQPDEPTTVDSHITIVRPKKDLFYLEYFGYAAIAIEKIVQASGQGASGQTELAKSIVQNQLEISFPQSLKDQKHIVAKLDDLFSEIDKAIALQKNKIEEIKELEDQLLEKWFNNKKFQIYRLEDVCTFIGGSQPAKSFFEYQKNDKNIRLIQIRDYKSDKNVVYIPQKKARRFCSVSDVMIGRYGPPIFQILRGLDGAYNVALMKAEPKDNILNDYLFYFLKNKRIQKYVINKSGRAAGQSGVNKETLQPYPIHLPSLDKQKEIVSKAKELNFYIGNLVNFNNRKLQQFYSLKDSILSKQMQN